jgi:5-methylcytosine-specific restriction endonuclease McrA
MRNKKGQFIKGNKDNIGRKHTLETKKKMGAWQLGRKLSDTTKKRMSETKKRLGIKPPSTKGQKRSFEFRKHQAEMRKGKKCYFWKGGVTDINLKIRGSLEYRLWREAVFARDKYTCIWCGDNRGGNLEADHIKPFSLYPELRFAIDNGRTLCKNCHKKTETYGNNKIYRLP